MQAHDNATTILVIDRRRLFQSLIRDTLEQQTCRVIAAADAPEGLARLERDPISLVVVDLLAPGDSGLAAMIAIRMDSDVPILAVGRHCDAQAPTIFSRT